MREMQLIFRKETKTYFSIQETQKSLIIKYPYFLPFNFSRKAEILELCFRSFRFLKVRLSKSKSFNKVLTSKDAPLNSLQTCEIKFYFLKKFNFFLVFSNLITFF